MNRADVCASVHYLAVVARVVMFALLHGMMQASVDAIAAAPIELHRIGVMMQPVTSQEAGLRQGLDEFGYVEGTNIIIDWRPSAARNQELQAIAESLARSGVELIVASGTPAARAAQATNLPVVFLAIDPVASGLVANLAKPGGSCTGISALGAEPTAKRLELLQAFVPHARRIVYFMNSKNPSASRLLDNAKGAARALGLQLIVLDARNAEEIDAAFRAIRSGALTQFCPHQISCSCNTRINSCKACAQLSFPRSLPRKSPSWSCPMGPNSKKQCVAQHGTWIRYGSLQHAQSCSVLF